MENPPSRTSPAGHVRSLFPYAPRSIWKGVPEAQWNDWRWQQRERITSLEQLDQVIQLT